MKRDTNTHYEWPSGSAVTQVDVRTQKNGQSVAYLYANPDAPKEKLAEIRASLRLKGWGTLSDSRDGHYVLRVAGIRNNDELIATLRGQQGTPKNEHVLQNKDEAKAESKGIVNAVKSRTLRWSGILATVGNAMSIGEGVLRGFESHNRDPIKNPNKFEAGQFGMGLAFAVADLPLALVDEHDSSRQLNLLLKKLSKEYDRNGIEIPKNASIYVEISNKGKTFGQLGQDYLHAYANQIKCGLEVVAAGFSIKAGLKQGNADKIKAAAIFGPGFLASLIIPEKKIDDEKYAKAGIVERAWMKIQSNPLSVGGLLGYSNTYFTYKSAINERKRFHNEAPQTYNKKDGTIIPASKYYPIDFTIPTVMIGANGLYAASKKTVGGSIDSAAVEQDAYRIAAQIINKQPDGELREKAVETTARFFAKRMEINGNYQEIRERLSKELDSQRQNPWFELHGLAPYASIPKRSHNLDVQLDIASANTLPAAPSTTIERADVQHVAQGIAHHTAEAAASQLR